MLITKQSIITGVVHTKEIDVTLEQLNAWMGGMLIQRAMPNLSMSDREFILNGITQEEWDEHMKDPDEDELSEADCWDGDDSQSD